MKTYLEFLRYILNHGIQKSDRTGVGTQNVFGYQMRFDLKKGFPLLTTKKMHYKSIFHELLWFLSGETNIRYLQENGVRIWNEWADEKGDLGPVYGCQWRAWPGEDGQSIDQISQLIHDIKTNPNSRRLIVSAWNVGQLSKMALPPCHLLFQFFVAEGHLSCMLTQRSADAFLGVPFNIASYALLTHMVAQQCDLIPSEFIWSGGDVHIYQNHLDQVHTQLIRDPLPLPTLRFARRPASIFEYRYEDILVEGYQSHSVLPGVVAV